MTGQIDNFQTAAAYSQILSQIIFNSSNTNNKQNSYLANEKNEKNNHKTTNK